MLEHINKVPNLNCFMLHINDFVLCSEGNESSNVQPLISYQCKLYTDEKMHHIHNEKMHQSL